MTKKIYSARINAHVSVSGERTVRKAGNCEMGTAMAKVIEMIMRKAVEYYITEKEVPTLNDLDKRFGISKSCGDSGVEIYTESETLENQSFFLEFTGTSLVVSVLME